MFQGVVDRMVCTVYGQRSNGNMPVQGGVGIEGVVLPVHPYGLSAGTVHVVFNGMEIIREVGTALMGDQNIGGGTGYIDVILVLLLCRTKIYFIQLFSCAIVGKE